MIDRVQAEVSSIKGDLVYTFQKRWRSFEKDDKQLVSNEPYDPSGQSEWWCDANFDDLPCDSMHRLIIHSRHLRNANLPNWKKSISRLIGNFTQIWPKYLLINISAPLRLVSDFPQLLFHFLRQRSLWARSKLGILCYKYIENVTIWKLCLWLIFMRGKSKLVVKLKWGLWQAYQT